MCCPEDVRCTATPTHETQILCCKCEIALCRQCFLISQKRDEYGIPEAPANYHGYVTAIIYKYKVRWIEAAAACPILIALITYYAEGDRGHLMEEEMHGPQRGYNVRGNCFSFHMPWEEIMKQIGRVEADDGHLLLPHPPEVLRTLVLFSLRIGEVDDLNKFLPQARLRPHVVLKLCIALLESGYPFTHSAHDLRQRFLRKDILRRSLRLQNICEREVFLH